MKFGSKILSTSAAAFCAIVLAAPIAQAAPLSSTDRAFLVSTAQGATYELAVAKLALTKSTRSEVKSYAQTMISDHDSLNPELHQLANQNGIDLPTTMTDEKQRSYDHLKSLDGKAFDAAFVKDEAKDNGDDVATEQKEISSTDNASVKAFVSKLKRNDDKHAKIGKSLQQSGQ